MALSFYPECANDASVKPKWWDHLHCAMSHYKFVLAIENTWTESYVTEKLFYALDSGAVPIYFGAPNVLDFVPPHSIIDGTKFSSKEELASYLKNLANDPVAYAEYHAWRRCGVLGNYGKTRAASLDTFLADCPRIPGGDPRNYPSTGSSVLLPLDENEHSVDPEVLVCGGAPRGAYQQALRGTYVRAISTCGRLRITDQNASWVMETMPIPRVMGDMLLLPTGDVIIINGGQLGTAGWELGRQAATRPVMYHPSNPSDQRFSVMEPSPRPRMYHSAAILLTDGRVLVGGGNPHIYYNFSDVVYPTDLSLETFSPPYLSTQYASIRPVILSVDDTVSPGKRFLLSFSVGEYIAGSVLSVRIVAPSFTTHSYSMNQRMVVLRIDEIIDNETSSSYSLIVVGPSSAQIAPPGYYLLYVVHSGIPSSGVWVRLQ